jgi:hypothetical protein
VCRARQEAESAVNPAMWSIAKTGILFSAGKEKTEEEDNAMLLQ